MSAMHGTLRCARSSRVFTVGYVAGTATFIAGETAVAKLSP